MQVISLVLVNFADDQFGGLCPPSIERAPAGDPSNCRQYVLCEYGTGSPIGCPDNQFFNILTNECGDFSSLLLSEQERCSALEGTTVEVTTTPGMSYKQTFIEHSHKFIFPGINDSTAPSVLSMKRLVDLYQCNGLGRASCLPLGSRFTEATLDLRSCGNLSCNKEVDYM